jgi:hypothetical protein
MYVAALLVACAAVINVCGMCRRHGNTIYVRVLVEEKERMVHDIKLYGQKMRCQMATIFPYSFPRLSFRQLWLVHGGCHKCPVCGFFNDSH